jgi:hypothetical protein
MLTVWGFKPGSGHPLTTFLGYLAQDTNVKVPIVRITLTRAQRQFNIFELMRSFRLAEAKPKLLVLIYRWPTFGTVDSCEGYQNWE